MSDERLYSLKLGLDATAGAKNIRQFHTLFNKTLKDMGENSPDIKAFKELARQAEQSVTALDDVDQEMGDLVRSYNKLKAEAGARDKLKFIPDKEIERQITAVRKHFATLKKSGKLSASELSRAYAETERQISSLRNQTEISAAKTESSLTRLTKRVGGLVAAFVGLRQLGNIATSVLRTGDQFEKLDKQLTALTGSSEKASDALDWIKEFTSNTPLQLEQVTEQFAKLKAFGLDPMDGSLQAIVDQNEAVGGSYENLQGIVLAFGQAFSKGKLQAEEMNQLIEKTVPIQSLLAKTLGKSTAEISKMASEGKLTQDVISRVLQTMGDANSGAAAANMSTMSGYVSNLKDEWTSFLNEIAEAGILDSVKDSLSGLLSRIQELKRDGTLSKWAQQISNTMVAFGESVKTAGSLLIQFKNQLALLGSLFVSSKVLGGIGAMSGKLGELGLRFRQTQMDAELSGQKIRKLGTVLRGLPSVIPITLSLIGFKIAYNGIEAITEKIVGLEAAEQRLAQSKAEYLNVSYNLAAAYRQEAEALGTVRDMEYLSSEQLKKLSAEERASYEQKLTSIQQYLALKVKQADVQKELGDELSTETKRAIELYNGHKSALKELTDANEYVAKAMRNGISVEAQQAVDHFHELRDSGLSTADALKTVGSSLNLSNMDDLRTFNALLKDIEQTGTELSDDLKQALGDITGDLDINRLRELETVINATFSNAEDKARALSTIIKVGLEDELGRLGLSFEELETGIDAAGTQAVKDFQAVVEVIRQTGTEADIASEKILEAYQSALNSTDDTEAIKQLNEELKSAGDEGLVAGEKVKEALSETADSGEEAGQRINAAANTATDGLKETEIQADATSEALETSANKAAELARMVGEYLSSTAEELAQLSQQTANIFAGKMGLEIQPVLNDVDQLKEGIQQAQQAIINGQTDMLTRGMDTTGLNQFVSQIGIAKNEAVLAFNQQKLAYLELEDAINSGDLTGNELIRAAETATNRFNLLDNTDLRNLEQSIANARREMESLNDSAANTLSNLQNELDRLQGNTAAIEERQYQEKKAELQAAIDQARAAGNAEAAASYTEALRVLEQIQREKEQQRKDDDAARQKQIEETNAAKSSSSTPQPAQKETPGQRVDLRLPNGQTASLTGDPGDVEALLDYLAEAQLSTTE
ncbi:hypothetical protein BGP77_11425 [Saccharospirillum sp. MSK14-1]|uniref:tape measure protein n=1 Tax=Saccharospirillum sp. MSK14-1 TaxID=1897632 RepID=UPI000D35D865|nr:tape measure protein [Saccharospirillum sp. MSK14-1]PTY38551.1 hypothetical protein BGP77_11425 [Saccharospirillum sp. MSK14-1]